MQLYGYKLKSLADFFLRFLCVLLENAKTPETHKNTKQWFLESN